MNQLLNQELTEIETTERLSEVHYCCSVDWLEFGGCGEWKGTNSSEWVERFEQTRNTAAITRQDEPLTIADHILMISGHGMGSGRQSRLEYVFTWGPVFVGLSDRDSNDLKHQNFYVKIPGDACLRYGEKRCREVVNEIFEEIGFVVSSDSVKRIDVCLDVAGMALQDELLPACERGQIKGSLLRAGDRLALHGLPRTGLSLGNRKSVRINFYDKRHEALQKNEQYLAEMKQNRWHGILPEKALRLEYQLDGAWLRRWGLRDVDVVIHRLADIVKYLTDDSSHPLFVVVDSIPDRKNKNQSRCETLACWRQVIERFQDLAGNPAQPLEAIDSGLLTAKKAFISCRGFLTSAGVILRMPITRFEDAYEILRELYERNDGTDEDWKQRFETKAKKAGVLEEMMAFRFGDNVKPVPHMEVFDDREAA